MKLNKDGWALLWMNFRLMTKQKWTMDDKVNPRMNFGNSVTTAAGFLFLTYWEFDRWKLLKGLKSEQETYRLQKKKKKFRFRAELPKLRRHSPIFHLTRKSQENPITPENAYRDGEKWIESSTYINFIYYLRNTEEITYDPVRTTNQYGWLITASYTFKIKSKSTISTRGGLDKHVPVTPTKLGILTLECVLCPR